MKNDNIKVGMKLVSISSYWQFSVGRTWEVVRVNKRSIRVKCTAIDWMEPQETQPKAKFWKRFQLEKDFKADRKKRFAKEHPDKKYEWYHKD